MKKIDRLVERCAAYLESLHTDKKTGFYACAAAALRRMPPELLHKNPSNIARPSAPAHQALYEALSAAEFYQRLVEAPTPRARIELFESQKDFDSGWSGDPDAVLRKYEERAITLRRAALALADAAQGEK